jgi:hypothetical protein
MHPWTHVVTQTTLGTDLFRNMGKDISPPRFPVAYRSVITAGKTGSATVAQILARYGGNIGPVTVHDSFNFK